MRALIIENQWDVDNDIKAFLKDHADMFTSVREELYCAHRHLEEFVPMIMESDAIIVASTFMDKDQLEDYVDAFLDGPFKDLPMKFYICNFVYHLTKWKRSWDSERELRGKIAQLVQNGREILCFSTSYGTGTTTDDFNYMNEDRERSVTGIHPLQYSKEHDIFYTADRYDTLECILKEENDAKERKAKKSV